MKKSLALILALSGCALAPFAQEEGQEEGDGPQSTPPAHKDVTTVTEMERLFRAYGVMHGGREVLNGVDVVAFRLVPHQVTDEGELEQPPLNVTLQVRGDERACRLEEELEGRHAVKIVEGPGAVRTWLDGEEREIPELMRDALQEATMLFRLLDLVYNPESPELRSQYRGYKTRGGVQYHTADYEFHPSRLDPYTYRQFYHPDSGLVARIDVHDQRTQGNVRTYSIYLSDYAPVGEGEPNESVKAPGRIEFRNRDDSVMALWRWTDFQVNPEVESDFFRRP